MSTNNYRKPFNPELFKKLDRLGKDTVKEYFKKQGCYLIDNVFNEFAVDLIEIKTAPGNMLEIVSYWEVEIRQTWKTGKFHYPTLRLPMRKMKFKGANFCVVNSNQSWMMIIPAELLETSTVEYVENKYSNGHAEPFISIKVEDCKMVQLAESEPDDPDELYS